MISNALAVGNLREVLDDVWQQEIDEMKFSRWLHHGKGVSYARFWGEG